EKAKTFRIFVNSYSNEAGARPGADDAGPRPKGNGPPELGGPFHRSETGSAGFHALGFDFVADVALAVRVLRAGFPVAEEARPGPVEVIAGEAVDAGLDAVLHAVVTGDRGAGLRGVVADTAQAVAPVLAGLAVRA